MPDTRSGPLRDLRVLDLGHVLAGPFAATLLGDLGADVIKIEHPVRVDTIRVLGPRQGDVSLWWKVAGRNKRSVCLDLSTPAGRDLLLQLAEQADAVVENFRPGTLERWGLAPERLWEANPRLVVLRISGFGQEGSGQGRPGFGRVGEALSGAVHLTGESDGRPLHVGFSLGDATTGLMGAFGLLAAVLDARESGQGDVIDLALFESLFRMIEWQLPVADKLGRPVGRQGNRFPIGYAVGGSYRAADGRWVTISAATPAAIERVLALVGADHHANGGRPLEGDDLSSRMLEIDRCVTAWIGERGADEVVETFERHDVAVGLVYDAAMMLEDTFLRERGAIVEVEDPDLGTIRMPGVVPRLQRSAGSVRWPGPPLGRHTDEVLRELLGLEAEELDTLRGDGVIR